MIKQVEKSPKVALCRNCYGTGFVVSGILRKKKEVCPQCESSGRVTVSAKITYDTRPYKVENK